ncbi:hypothetical protein [Cellulomonas pakistanensis]|uniref:Uncharacterized protein n=1 Tax=Cellulomonas pakistanensis TaxID=992287 RepID=A0A919PCG7_9CELL|nr:hypothetical protein [Cellulomonas pakistanensis]GIG37648.1 hypothetical protein Cpa01nite_30290 [Cellulomonas pakistanensis]
MAALDVDLDTVSLAGQVLSRQAGHCRSTAAYLSVHGSISGSTGLILAGLAPVSDAVTAAGTGVLRTAGSVCDATAHAAQRSADTYASTDHDARTRFERLSGAGTHIRLRQHRPVRGPGRGRLPPYRAGGGMSTDRIRLQREPLAGRLREIEELVRAATAQIEQLAMPDDRDARLEAERAEAARSGALGRDWQRVQERIDTGTVTLADVFSGVDDSPEAEHLRARSSATLRSASEESEHDPDGSAAELLREILAARRPIADRNPTS